MPIVSSWVKLAEANCEVYYHVPMVPQCVQFVLENFLLPAVFRVVSKVAQCCDFYADSILLCCMGRVYCATQKIFSMIAMCQERVQEAVSGGERSQDDGQTYARSWESPMTSREKTEHELYRCQNHITILNEKRVELIRLEAQMSPRDRRHAWTYTMRERDAEVKRPRTYPIIATPDRFLEYVDFFSSTRDASSSTSSFNTPREHE
eukprot:GEMP01038854.1.p1 GENE.GEMP01038854.1~~GEMP01038854.1.p1  ORF type:complete len:206 (+),score=28.21 GEMP01038854.1:94-711(+)